MTQHSTPLWHRERLGLSMIAGSLFAIAATVFLLFSYLQQDRAERIRAQGTSLARVLASAPLEELVADGRPSVLLRALNASQDTTGFAYAVIIAADGTALAEVAAPGALIPPFRPAGGRSIAEVEYPQAPGGNAILEYQAPVQQGGANGPVLRLGYRTPGFGPSASQLSMVATLALIIFLLTPLFYFLVRREIQPIASANSRLQDLLERQQLAPLQVSASGELGQFMGRFNEFIHFASERINDLEADRERVLTSTKLLSYRKDRITRVLESLPDAVLVLDDSGTITFVNSRFATLFAVEPATLTGSASLDWCTQDQTRDFLTGCAGTGSAFLPEPREFQQPDAPGVTLQIAAYPLFAPGDGKVIGSLVVVRDITIEALARNGRAEFVAHISHELKTPLNVLAMYSEMLAGEAADDLALRVEAANVIHDEVERLSLLINNLLSLTRIEMGSLDTDKQRVRLRDLLEDVFANARHHRGANELEFELDLPAEMSALELDKDLLRIALNNLLTNAIKYNNPGGKVSLHAEETDDAVHICVRDTGIGIDQADQARVFDKFFRSEEDEVRERSGHGLGLALAHDIVALHQGSISVSSNPGEGTEFRIEFLKQTHDMRKAV